MTRGEAWEKFLTEHQAERDSLKETFADSMKEKMEQLMNTIYSAFGRISDMAKEGDKQDCVYFHFSLQRCDLLEEKAVYRLEVMDAAWYMDEKKLVTELDMTFLFETYFVWKKKLLLDMRPYMGRVNRYDVENLIQDEIMSCNRIIAHLLRFTFRNLEKQNCFNTIGKLSAWIIRWGEYKDYSEIVMRVNRQNRGEEEWLEQLENYGQDKTVMMLEHWYRAQLSKGNCSRKKLCFTTFEDCCLKEIDFSKAELSGARFIRCRITKCNFTWANLRQADFEDCIFDENQFQKASLLQTTFSQHGFPWQDFTEKQLEELLVIREEK